MGKFVISCPECGNYTVASKVFNRKVTCTCGYEINVKYDSVISKECPYCKNTVIFDQSLGEKALCPVCQNPINTVESKINSANIHCTQCKCEIVVNKEADSCVCPLCDTVIDVKRALAVESRENAGIPMDIKYNGDMLVYKYPLSNYVTGTQLIVGPGQQALFVLDGKDLDLFDKGSHPLNTAKMPAFSDIFSLSDLSALSSYSDVYYFDVTDHPGIRWGTPSKIDVVDPKTQLQIPLGMCGTFSFKIRNARKLFLKLVGSKLNMLSAEELFSISTPIGTQFRSDIQNIISAVLPGFINDNVNDIYFITNQIAKLSNVLFDRVSEAFDEYGIQLLSFIIGSFRFPDRGENGFSEMQEINSLHKGILMKLQNDFNSEIEIAKLQSEKAIALEKKRNERDILEAQNDIDELNNRKRIHDAETAAIIERIQAKSKAESISLIGHAKADVMNHEGANAKDILDADVQKAYAKAYAESLTKAPYQSPIIVPPTAPGYYSQTPQVMGYYPPQPTAQGFMPPYGIGSQPGFVPAGSAATGWSCPNCSTAGIQSSHCPNCGHKKPDETSNAASWDCPNCGEKNISSKYCPGCGYKSPLKSCPNCGATGLKSAHCPNCGAETE